MKQFCSTKPCASCGSKLSPRIVKTVPMILHVALFQIVVGVGHRQTALRYLRLTQCRCGNLWSIPSVVIP